MAKRKSKASSKAFKGVTPPTVPPREKSGRPQRESVEEIKSVAVSNRMKHDGLTEEQAVKETGGHAAGQLFEQGIITNGQMDAAYEWHRRYVEAGRYLHKPREHKSCLAGEAGGHDNVDPESPDYIRKAREAQVRYQEVSQALGQVREAIFIHYIASNKRVIEAALPYIASGCTRLCQVLGYPAGDYVQKKKRA